MIIIGYLLVALFSLGVFLLIVKSGDRPRSSLAPWILGGFLVCLVLVVPRCAWQQEPDWNPVIRSDADILGTWKDRTHTLILAPDHTFTYQADAKNTRGTWKRDDWNLYLQDEQNSSLMRVVQAGGRYRVLIHPLGDPDAWDGDLGLERVQP